MENQLRGGAERSALLFAIDAMGLHGIRRYDISECQDNAVELVVIVVLLEG